jgi:hypothetical protein
MAALLPPPPALPRPPPAPAPRVLHAKGGALAAGTLAVAKKKEEHIGWNLDSTGIWCDTKEAQVPERVLLTRLLWRAAFPTPTPLPPLC